MTSKPDPQTTGRRRRHVLAGGRDSSGSISMSTRRPGGGPAIWCGQRWMKHVTGVDAGRWWSSRKHGRGERRVEELHAMPSDPQQTTEPRLLDLFCCAGGAGMGYAQAGFDVVGVDIIPRPRYPFKLVQSDVLALGQDFLRGFDVIHASPPCQGYTAMRHAPGAIGAPMLIDQVRDMLVASGKPWVIENVEEARWAMRDPILLCGTMFGLRAEGCEMRRHRLFESNVQLAAPCGCAHTDGPVVGVYGGHARVRSARHGGRTTRDVWPNGHRPVAAEAMGMSWATLAEMSEAIPPAYTKNLGEQFMTYIAERRMAA